MGAISASLHTQLPPRIALHKSFQLISSDISSALNWPPTSMLRTIRRGVGENRKSVSATRTGRLNTAVNRSDTRAAEVSSRSGARVAYTPAAMTASTATISSRFIQTRRISRRLPSEYSTASARSRSSCKSSRSGTLTVVIAQWVDAPFRPCEVVASRSFARVLCERLLSVRSASGLIFGAGCGEPIERPMIVTSLANCAAACSTLARTISAAIASSESPKTVIGSRSVCSRKCATASGSSGVVSGATVPFPLPAS